MARKSKSPVSSLAIVGIALLMFIAAVGIGVSMLGGKDDKPDVSESESESAPVFEPSESEEVSASESESASESASEEVKPSESEEAKPSESTAPSESQAPESKPTESQPTEEKAPEIANTSDSGFSNIANFKKINSDVKGWLKIPGTNINYPVLHRSQDHFYLNHDINKQPSHDAVIYADPAVTFGTRSQIAPNTVLYGHNWTNYSAQPAVGRASDVMFAQLTAYQYLDFAKQHPYIYYSTEAEEMVWQVFATFYTDINFIYNYAYPPSTANFQSIINGAKARSRNNFDVSVSTSDRILTLSTCTRAYGKSANQRFVVMAKLMPKGAALNPVTVTTNPNPVLPSMSVLFPGK